MFFDIVFLDILMRDLDGMDTAQIFRKKAYVFAAYRRQKAVFLSYPAR